MINTIIGFIVIGAIIVTSSILVILSSFLLVAIAKLIVELFEESFEK